MQPGHQAVVNMPIVADDHENLDAGDDGPLRMYNRQVEPPKHIQAQRFVGNNPPVLAVTRFYLQDVRGRSARNRQQEPACGRVMGKRCEQTTEVRIDFLRQVPAVASSIPESLE